MLIKIYIFWDKKTNLTFRLGLISDQFHSMQYFSYVVAISGTGNLWYPEIPTCTELSEFTFTYNFVSNIHYTGRNLNEYVNGDRCVCVWLLFYIESAIFQLYHDPHGIKSGVKHHNPNPSCYQYIIEDKINNFHVISVQEAFFFHVYKLPSSLFPFKCFLNLVCLELLHKGQVLLV